jgi:hypothetical protein
VKRHELKLKFLIKTRLSLNRIGLRKKKVFAIGFNKTGTSSLHALFKSLGLPSYHGPKWKGDDNLRLLRLYDCFSDGAPKDLAQLDRMYPNSKFILQVRELDAWIYSRLAHIERQKERNKHRENPLWDNTEYSIRHWIRQRNAHHLSVFSYFAERPADLLVVNFIRDPSAATKVCNFLGYEGNYARPKKNINPQTDYPLKHAEMFNRCIAELGIPKSELSYDILSPSLISGEMRDRFPADTRMLD